MTRYSAPGSSGVNGMTLLALDGARVVVTSRHSSEGFWLYEEDGELVWHAEVPGPPPNTMGFLDGHLWVSDANIGRVLRLDGDLQVVDSVSFRAPSLPAGFLPAGPERMLPGQLFLYRPRIATEMLASGAVGAEPLLLVTGAGEIIREIATKRIRNGFVAIRTRAGEFFSFQPFSDDPLVAVSPTGRRLLHVDREVGRGWFVVTQIESSGDTVALTRRNHTPIRLDPARAEAAVTAMVTRFARSSVAGTVDPDSVVREALFIPATLPPVTGAVIGDDGVAWIRREVTIAGTVQWEVYDPSGELLGTVDLPTADVVLRVGGLEAWVGRSPDERIGTLTRMRLVARADP